MAQPRRQTGERYAIPAVADVPELVTHLNAILGRLTTRLDQMAGFNGTPTFHGAVDMTGQRIMHVAAPSQPDDAVPNKMALTLINDPQHPGAPLQWDAQSLQIFNLADGNDRQDGVTVGQLRQMMQQHDVTNEAFVVAVASSILTAERLLSGEATVITITDNGPNSTIVVSVTANGITDAKLRQGVALSVVGRSANSVGNVADIVAASDGQVLRRAGTALAFGAVSLATAAAVTGALGIANGGTGQTTQTAAFNALDPLTTKGDVIAHDGTNSVRLTVGTNGQLPVADSTAAAGIAWKGTVPTYTASNVTTDRSYDADATTLDELADILGTLLSDLRTFGIIL